jgi:plastocyanin
MLRAILILGSAAITALAGCSTNTPGWSQASSTNKPRKNVTVQFTDATLHPETARVTQGGSVGWINYSTGFDGSVVFADSILSSFTCSDLRPIFMKVAAGYQSIPIKEGGPENVTLPCPLEPGEYEYELWLFSPGTLGGVGQGAGAGMDDPQSQMKGKIVVE